jgi:uracil-DNA glycosylase
MSPDASPTDASPWVPTGGGLRELRAAVHECRGCELYRDATAVSSTGPRTAKLMLVGEQPGDREDREGEPFVGPAGHVLDEALAAAGIPRAEVYLTNAVKHFRHEDRGARRIHKTPAVGHIDACRPWLERELALVRPRVVVCMGATAARAVLGRTVRIGDERGTAIPLARGVALVTAHPSAVLRLRGHGGYDEALEQLAADLRTAAALARG